MKRLAAGPRVAASGLLLFSCLLVFGSAPAPAPSLAFPRDHGSHPAAAIEWWYYTGNLSDPAGHPFGFQLTFFRVGDFALAHGAWTDGARRAFEFQEKAHLILPGIAEFAEGRLEVSNEDWSASARDEVHRLRLRWEKRAVDLVLTAAKPPVLQGQKGFSRKGPGENEYSHYVSIPLLEVSGTLVEGGRRSALSGTAWFDHEWGPGALPAGAAGWDWFALQLDDRSELMLYRIRTKEGGATPFSSGVFVPPSGDPVPLRWDEVRFRATGEWRSPRSKGVYPSGWDIALPRLSLALRVEPLVADQELVTGRSTGVTYWEGACRVTGQRGGKPLTGKGYAELTGYSGRDVPGFTSR
ncbi:MAG: lipocalin-like domain-containing protein [Acidobacteriota bacterium]